MTLIQTTSSSHQLNFVVSAYDLLESGDSYIKDFIRNDVLEQLKEPVRQNLWYQPGSSVRDESLKDDEITSVVARIEYKVYDKNRGEADSRCYTATCNNLEKEILKCNKDQECHERVLKALEESSATK